MTRIVLITTSFPPAGGPGVQRNLKNSKYWSRMGHRVDVITLPAALASTTDETLMQELPESVIVHRPGSVLVSRAVRGKIEGSGAQPRSWPIGATQVARKTLRGLLKWAMLPDYAGPWVPVAAWQGYRLTANRATDVVVGSCPGPSALIAAGIVARLRGLPLVFDYRDGWSNYPYRTLPTPLHRILDSLLERWIIPLADHHVVIGEFLAEWLHERFSIPTDQISVIHNGFDPEDFAFESDDSTPQTRRIRIAHVGNLSENRLPELATFIEGLGKLAPELQRDISLQLVGQAHPSVQVLADQAQTTSEICVVGYVDHAEAIAYMQSSTALLVLLPSFDSVALTGKIFEYLAVRRPILAVARPETGCATIVKSLGRSGVVVAPGDSQSVAEAITSLATAGWPTTHGADLSAFDRQAQASRFSEILGRVVSEVNRGRNQ